jgi:uncharacterized membrane protein YhaH (DUF805 family)
VRWYLKALKQYAVFSGRAQRKEYWLFFLFHIVINLVIVNVFILIEGTPGLGLSDTPSVYGPLIYSLYNLAVLIPGIAVSVRRLHDTNHSGWWLLINLVPLVGVIVFFLFMVRDSEPHQNQYGPNPKLIGALGNQWRMTAEIVGGILGLLLLSGLVYSSLEIQQHTCEVCVEFQGRTQCRTAEGANQRTAVQTAIDNACIHLIKSKTEEFLCKQTSPVRVTCQKR